MQQESKKAIFAAVWIIGLTIGLIAYINIAINATNSRFNENSMLNPRTSTNPNSPDQLYEANPPLLENYNTSSTSYYYYGPGVPIYYALFELYTVSSSNNFDLYLYSDSGYSNLVGTSNTTNQLDWIVYRVPAFELYLRTYTFTGSGEAYLHYEFSADINVKSARSVSLFPKEYAEIYQIPLSTLTNYTVFLNASAESNYDLYVFRTPDGSATRYDFHNSTSTSTGQYERIVFTPLYNDTYAIVIVQASGGGAATLTVYDYVYSPSSGGVPGPNGIPVFELFPILLALTANIFIYLTIPKKHNSFF